MAWTEEEDKKMNSDKASDESLLTNENEERTN